jgi:hypothetical protein
MLLKLNSEICHKFEQIHKTGNTNDFLSILQSMEFGVEWNMTFPLPVNGFQECYTLWHNKQKKITIISLTTEFLGVCVAGIVADYLIKNETIFDNCADKFPFLIEQNGDGHLSILTSIYCGYPQNVIIQYIEHSFGSEKWICLVKEFCLAYGIFGLIYFLALCYHKFVTLNYSVQEKYVCFVIQAINVSLEALNLIDTRCEGQNCSCAYFNGKRKNKRKNDSKILKEITFPLRNKKIKKK